MAGWVHKLPWQNIKEHSDQFNIDPYLIGSIIMVESAGNRYAVRYESGWKYAFECRSFASRLMITEKTEEICQKMSWGLMQIMGTVARELGHFGQLPELLDIDKNIFFGCKKIKQLQEVYGGIGHISEMDVISSYNAGSVVKNKGGTYLNETYVDKVYTYLRELRGE